jgi:dipeptidase E
MAGTTYLGGGGSADDEAQLWHAMLSRNRKVLYWPFAIPPEGRTAAADWFATSLDHLGVIADIETWADLDGRSPEDPLPADLLFVGGGNTFTLLDHVRRAGYLGTVRAFVAAGGDYYGGSAGAILACESIALAAELDSNDVGLVDLQGLGLVSGFAVFPHYTPDRAPVLRAWIAQHHTTVVGIPERSGLVVDDGLARVEGTVAAWEITAARAVARPPGYHWRPGA